MIFEPRDAKQLLANTVKDTLERGKDLLGESWNNFTEEERDSFQRTLTLLAQLKIADLAGMPDGPVLLRGLEVAAGEWKLAGKTQVLSIMRQLADDVLGRGSIIAGGLFRGFITKL